MKVWNDAKWWAACGVEMYRLPDREDELIVIADPIGGKKYSISPKEGELIDLWASEGLTSDLIARLLIGLTDKDPILGSVITYFDEFSKMGVSVAEAREKLDKALKIIEGSGLAEIGKESPDPPRYN